MFEENKTRQTSRKTNIFYPLIRTKRMFQENKARLIFRKTNISYPLIRTLCAYQGVRNVRFLENWRPLFSWNTRFVIGLFALLPMCWSEIFLSHKLIRKPASLNNRVVHHFYQLIRICPSNRNLFIYKLLIVLSRMHQNKVNNIFMPGRSCSIITTFIIAWENNVHVIGKIILNHLLGFHETWILLRWYSFMI